MMARCASAGAELAVLRSLGPRLARARVVLAEYHRRADRRHIDALLTGHDLFGMTVHDADRGVVKYARAGILPRRR